MAHSGQLRLKIPSCSSQPARITKWLMLMPGEPRTKMREFRDVSDFSLWDGDSLDSLFPHAFLLFLVSLYFTLLWRTATLVFLVLHVSFFMSYYRLALFQRALLPTFPLVRADCLPLLFWVRPRFWLVLIRCIALPERPDVFPGRDRV